MRTNRNVTKLRHDIKDALLQLRMSPLEQELEKQYDQPHWEQLGFERRLAEALQNVCDQRNSKNFQKMMQNACISPDRYKLEDNNRFFIKIVKANLLILDDFLLEVPTEQECRWLHEIIQNRYQKRATIILSQKPMQTWPQIMPQAAATDAVVDRLVHFSHYFQLKGEKSLRTFID